MCALLVAALLMASPVQAQSGGPVRWEFGAPQRVAESGGPTIAICHATSLRLTDARGATLWTLPLPERSRKAIGGYCECTTAAGAPCAAEVRDYLATHAGVPPGVIGVERVGGALIVADGSGLLAIDAQSGRVLLDVAAAGSTGGFFDKADWELSPSCRGHARHGAVFARCGDELLFALGNDAMIVSGAPPGIAARAPMRSTGRAPRVELDAPLGTRTLRVRGVVYLR